MIVDARTFALAYHAAALGSDPIVDVFAHEEYDPIRRENVDGFRLVGAGHGLLCRAWIPAGPFRVLEPDEVHTPEPALAAPAALTFHVIDDDRRLHAFLGYLLRVTRKQDDDAHVARTLSIDIDLDAEAFADPATVRSVTFSAVGESVSVDVSRSPSGFDWRSRFGSFDVVRSAIGTSNGVVWWPSTPDRIGRLARVLDAERLYLDAGTNGGPFRVTFKARRLARYGLVVTALANPPADSFGRQIDDEPDDEATVVRLFGDDADATIRRALGENGGES